MAGFPSLRNRLKRQVKIGLAGSNLEALVENRDRRRLRWLAEESNEPVLRFRALRNLAEIIDPQSEQMFLRIIQRPAGDLPTAEVRTAAEGLGRLVCRDAAPALIRLLEPNRPAAVNLAAARALATLGSPRDWQAVRRWVIRSDQDNPPLPDYRDVETCEGSEHAGATPAIWVLQVLYPEKGLRWWTGKAAAWLSSEEPGPRIGTERGADRVVAQNLRKELERSRPGDDEFRHKVLLLGNLSRDRDHGFFEQLAAAETDPARRDSVLHAWSLCSDPRAVPEMKARLASMRRVESGELTNAVRCAGRIASRELVGPIFETWPCSTTQESRCNLFWALGECGGGESVSQLVELVRSREEDLSELDFQWIGRALLRCGGLGREAVRGGVTIARAGGGERDRMRRLAAEMGLS